MATKVASIFAEVGLDSSKFTKGAGGVTSSLGGLVKGIGSLHPAVAVLGTALGAVSAYLQDAGKEAGRFAEINAKQDAILRATGGAAGFTADQLDRMSRELS